MSSFTDYLIENYDGQYKDYTVLTGYRLEQDKKDRESRKIVGLNTQVIDDTLENQIPESVKKGLEVHVDFLEEYSSKADSIEIE